MRTRTVLLFATLALAAACGRLSYTEQEALAIGQGFAMEVKRAAEKFFIAEKRMPCRADKYIDVDSLLRDKSRELSIELVDCGRFVVTIHTPINGVADGELLFVASPGDADAGRALNWHCSSAHLEYIERNTNGKCVYDSSLQGMIE